MIRLKSFPILILLLIRRLKKFMKIPTRAERLEAWRAGRRDGRIGVPPDDASFRKDLIRRANLISAKATALFRDLWHELVACGIDLEDQIAEVVEKAAQINREAASDPIIHPIVTHKTYHAVAAIAVLAELILSFAAFRDVNIPPIFAPILAAAFAIGLVALAHVIGAETRRAVRIRWLSSLVVIALSSAFAVVLIAGVTSLRQVGTERAIEVKARAQDLITKPESKDQVDELLTDVFAELSGALFLAAACFAFEAEYAGSRYGLAEYEHTQRRLKRKIFRLRGLQEGIRGVKESVDSAIKARFERLDLIYLRQIERWIAKTRRAEERRRRREASRQARAAARAQRTAARQRYRHGLIKLIASVRNPPVQRSTWPRHTNGGIDGAEDGRSFGGDPS